MDYKNETITDIIIETIEIKDKEENILGHAYKYNNGMLMIAMNKGNVILSEEAPKISEFKRRRIKIFSCIGISKTLFLRTKGLIMCSK